jgi:hypothetical protein
MKPRYHSSAVVGVLLSCQQNVASKEIRTDDKPGSTKFLAIQTLCDVEEGRRRRSTELPVARSGNCLCCYNPRRQRVSLFVRTVLITSLWFEISKDRYERSNHLPYRHPEAVAIYMHRKELKCWCHWCAKCKCSRIFLEKSNALMSPGFVCSNCAVHCRCSSQLAMSCSQVTSCLQLPVVVV